MAATAVLGGLSEQLRGGDVAKDKLKLKPAKKKHGGAHKRRRG